MNVALIKHAKDDINDDERGGDRASNNPDAKGNDTYRD